MAKRIKRKVRLTCRFCVTYNEGIVIYKQHSEDSKLKVLGRLCRQTGEEKGTDDFACRHFEPVKWIYCDNHDQRITIQICKNRRLNRTGFYENCGKCLQKRELDLIYELLPDKPARTLPGRSQIPTKAPPKRKLPKRPILKPVPKPKKKKSKRILVRRPL